MTEENQNSSKLDANLKGYVKVQYKIMSLEISNGLASLGSRLLSDAMLALCLLLAIFFLSVAGAICLTHLTNSYFAGLGMIAGFYVLLFLFLFAFKHRLLVAPIKDRIIRALLNEKA